MLTCVVLILVAIISLPFKKKVSVSGRLALSDIQHILLIDLQRLCSPVLFSYQGGRVRCVVDFVDTMYVCTHSVGI